MLSKQANKHLLFPLRDLSGKCDIAVYGVLVPAHVELRQAEETDVEQNNSTNTFEITTKMGAIKEKYGML